MTQDDSIFQPSLNLFPDQKSGNQKISFSKLRVFQRCPREYKLRYIDGSKLDVNTLDVQVGTLIHRLLSNYFQLQNNESNWFFDEAKINIDKVKFRDRDEKEFWINRTNQILKMFIEHTNLMNSFPFATELAFKVSFDHYLIKGKIDRIDKLENGCYEIIDYKLDDIRVDEHVNYNLQLLFYYWGIKNQYHFNIKKLTYYYLESGKTYSIDMDKKLEKQSHDEIVNLIEKMINEKNYNRFESAFCNICGVRKICK